MTDPSFADLAERLRERLADVEDRFLVDMLSREHADLQLHAATLAMQLKLAGLDPAEIPGRPRTLQVVA